MADGVRVVLADKGQDARDSALFCFGGAGGVHAPAVMQELGMSRLIVPRFASTFSAFGLLLSDIRHDLVRSLAKGLDDAGAEEVRAAYADMRDEAQTWLTRVSEGSADGSWRYRRAADLRYTGQSHEVRVDLDDEARGPAEIRRAFEAEYERYYGYLNDPSLIQLINLRLTAEAPTRKPSANGALSSAATERPVQKQMRDMYFAEHGTWAETPVLDGEAIPPGSCFSGPLVVELPSTTIAVRPRQTCRTDDHGNFIIESIEVGNGSSRG
jgi:N-methylhydantoinase A